MAEEHEEKGSCTCPLCKALEAAKHSDAAKHVRGLEREALMAARDLIDWCVERLDRMEARQGGQAGEQARKAQPK